MKILHFAETLPGGIATYLGEVYLFQTRQWGDDKVLMVVPAEHRKYIDEVPDRNIRAFRRRGRSVYDLVRMGFEFRKIVDVERPEIVHLHSTFAGLVGRLSLAFSRRRPVVVYCAHGWSFCQRVPLLHRMMYALVERVLCALADVIIHISAAERSSAKAWGFDGAKHHVIHNGISALRLSDMDLSRPEKLNLLFIGRHDRQKGLDVMLSSMKKVKRPDVFLEVAGAAVVGNDLINSDDHRVRFHGWLSKVDAESLISQSDVVVIPSRWEGFGLVAIEAMRAGKFVVASRVGALPEIITSETGVLFDVNSEDQLAAILESLSAVDVRGRSARIMECFNQNFEASIMNAKIATIYLLEYEKRLSRFCLDWEMRGMQGA